MGKFYTILKDFREILIGIIIWVIFDFKSAIIIILSYMIGELISETIKALKRYKPTEINITTENIEKLTDSRVSMYANTINSLQNPKETNTL